MGHLATAWFLGHDSDSLRSAVAAAQEAVREVSPFGIGAMIHNEAVNGPLERLQYTLPDGSRGFEAGDITIQGAFAADDFRCHETVPAPAAIHS
ncbi:hypothetical protein ABZT51_35455 [Streptomyces sp. NPDC005373]|uniref:hypothetical protein n=1 Tax=Streptomyces sp. NPDC005373 TaxID=3156879 RepID=UPI0033BEFA4C